MESTIYTDGTYLRNVHDWHTSDTPWKAAQIAILLERNEISPRSVHDVGCRVGEVLAQLRSRLGGDPEFFGMDIADDATELASRPADEHLMFERGDYLTADVSLPDATDAPRRLRACARLSRLPLRPPGAG